MACSKRFLVDVREVAEREYVKREKAGWKESAGFRFRIDSDEIRSAGGGAKMQGKCGEGIVPNQKTSSPAPQSQAKTPRKACSGLFFPSMIGSGAAVVMPRQSVET